MSNNKIKITKKNLIDFCKIINEFSTDLMNTFPELQHNLHPGIIDIMNILIEFNTSNDNSNMFDVLEEINIDEKECDDDEETRQNDNKYNELKERLVNNKNVIELYKYCLDVYPERFFDIIYQNEDIFTDDEVNTELLPDIDFSKIWENNISDNTKEVIWKYLQILLLCVISSVEDKTRFGNTAKLFEAIDENELKTKLEETIESMQNMFDLSNNLFQGGEGDSDEGMNAPNINLDGMPNADDIHNHIGSLMSGNLGNLAREIIEETADDLKIDFDDSDTAGDLFKKMFKNPGKLMGVIKNIEGKIDNKLKGGDFNEVELLKEAEEMMGKMKDIPGLKNIQGMLGKMGLDGLGGMGGNAKFNMGSFKNQMQENLKKAKMEERLRERLEKQRTQQNKQHNNVQNVNNPQPKYTDEELIQEFKFTTGEAPQRSSRKPKCSSIESKTQHKSKAGNGKNKKNKKSKNK